MCHNAFMKKLYLVRHAQSCANVDSAHLRAVPNPKVDLTTTGYQQAQETGNYLQTVTDKNVVLWNSPYYRTRQTAKEIYEKIATKNSYEVIKRESLYLSERQFGLVDEVVNYEDVYKNEHNHYDYFQKNDVSFFVRPPLGESPFDLCLRLDTFLNTEIETSSYDTHIVVSHGAAIKAILTMALRWEYEIYDKQINSANAAVRLLEKVGHDWVDKGYVFTPSIITR